jgi:glycosyltransferase involved in cell wall biosynthesis
MLPPDLEQRLCLVIAGQANAQERTRITAQISELQQKCKVQIITHCEFVPESDVQIYFQLADVVLAPYQKHVGMSGILIWAAVAQKPVLSSNYGLMGELVRRYRLGVVVDSTSPAQIAEGLVQCLGRSPQELGDPQQMQAFAQENSADKFAHTIFKALFMS